MSCWATGPHPIKHQPLSSEGAGGLVHSGGPLVPSSHELLRGASRITVYPLGVDGASLGLLERGSAPSLGGCCHLLQPWREGKGGLPTHPMLQPQARAWHQLSPFACTMISQALRCSHVNPPGASLASLCPVQAALVSASTWLLFIKPLRLASSSQGQAAPGSPRQWPCAPHSSTATSKPLPWP